MARFVAGLSRSLLCTRRCSLTPKSISNIRSLISQMLGALGMLLLLAVSPLNAQTDPSAGIQMWSTHEFGIDLATSAIYLPLPGRSKAGPIPFSSSLGGTNHAYVYNVNNHNFIGVQGFNILSYADTTSLGFTSTAHVTCGGLDGMAAKNLAVIDLTGALHPFPTTFQWNTYGSCANLPTVVTTDGSGYTFVPLTNGDPDATFALYDSSGRSYSGLCNNGDCFLRGSITDPDGNTLYHQVNGGICCTVQDSLTSTPVANWTNTSYLQSYTTSSGSTVGYTSGTTQANVRTNFGCGATEFSYGSTVLTTSLTQPDGGQYKFAYEPTPNGNGFTNTNPPTYFTGRIAQITFPDGGSVSYAYSGGHNGLDCISHVPTLTVTVNDNNGNVNNWTYVNNYVNIYSATVVKTDPAGNQTVSRVT